MEKEPDHYINENGLMVLTAQYLLSRGYCCGNGCLHCPYPRLPETENLELPSEKVNLYEKESSTHTDQG